MTDVNKETYKAYFYKILDNDIKPTARVFIGEDECDKAIKDGWTDSPAKCEGLVIPEEMVKQVEEASDLFAADVNVLANADIVEDKKLLEEAYQNIAGRKMHYKHANTLKGARVACKKLLGEVNGNG